MNDYTYYRDQVVTLNNTRGSSWCKQKMREEEEEEEVRHGDDLWSYNYHLALNAPLILLIIVSIDVWWGAFRRNKNESESKFVLFNDTTGVLWFINHWLLDVLFFLCFFLVCLGFFIHSFRGNLIHFFISSKISFTFTFPTDRTVYSSLRGNLHFLTVLVYVFKVYIQSKLL